MDTTVEQPNTEQVDGERVRDAEGREFVLREKRCPTCGISEQRVVGYRGGQWHRYGLGVATRIVQCPRCRLMFPNPFPYPQNPQALYGDPVKYFQARDEQSDERSRIADLRNLVAGLRQLTHVNSLLDVGSGRGELLEAARLEGVPEIVGLEISHAMAEYVQHRIGITLVPTTIERYAAEEPRTFDAIVLSAVLEHVDDPNAMIEACATLSTHGSILYIDTPNEPSLLTAVGNAWNRVRGNPAVLNLSPTWIPYHVFGFNPHALRVLLEKHGFEILRIRIHARPAIPSRTGLGDRVKSWVATQICRLSNVTGTAANLYVWAQRRERS